MYKYYANTRAINKAMMIKGLTNNELATILNISSQYLSNTRNRNINTSVVLAKRISEALEMSIEDLFTLKEVEKDEAAK